MDRESIMAMDPNILLSVINMKLRDTFSSLEELCEDIDISEKRNLRKIKYYWMYLYKRNKSI